ncbi:MAG: helix-turn-helix transcriptional regulator [Candidatus Coatesbacteria bacterium]
MAGTDVIYEQVGRALREIRTGAGLTQQQLAERAGLSVSFVSFLEAGRKKGSLETYHRLAHALGIPLARLFSGSAPAGWAARSKATGSEGLTAAEHRVLWRLLKRSRRGAPRRP